jgi:hypothetical protein
VAAELLHDTIVTPGLSAVASNTRLSVVPTLLAPIWHPAPAEDGGDDRRIHTRHTLADLTWLNEARLKYGPPVALIDLSAGGAQIELASHRLQPGTTVIFEVRGRKRALSIPASVLRAHIAGLRPHTTYRAALVFKGAFDLAIDGSDREAADRIDVIHEHNKLTVALQRLYASSGVARERIAAAIHPTEEATGAALAIARAACAERARNPLAHELGRMLRVLTNGIASGAAPETMVGQIADCLKRAMPARTIRVLKGGAPLIHSADAVHFDVPSADGGSPDRLVVECPSRCRLEPWHLEFLKAAAQLLTIVNEMDRLRVSSPPEDAPADMPAGWRRIVVRFADGRLVKGFCDEFLPATGHVHVCPSLHAPRESRVVVALTQLKAVFFVHDLQGGAARQGPDNQIEGGRRVDVTFADGELLSGTTLSYTRNGAGFFVYPLDAKSNNSRTFVVSSAVRHVQFP